MQTSVRSRVRLIPFVLALIAGMSVAAIAAAPGSASGATTHIVKMSGSGFSFSPTSITIAVGDTVKWVHDSGSIQHTATADDGSFDSGTMGPNATFSHTYTKAGSFRYYCKFHGGPGGVGMSGIVIVKAAGPTPTIKTVSPTSVMHGTSGDKIKLTGTNYATGVKVKFSGTGITIKSTQRVDASHITVTINVASSASRTKRSITVTNPTGATVTKTNALAIT